MPVRRIPKNHLFVTGRHATDLSSEMVEFESLLEKEYMLLLDFDPRVAEYEAQPVRIRLPEGRSYVPDILVRFHPGADGVEPPRELVEIKTQAHLERYAQEYSAKFAAAERYAQEMGWRFCTRTERDIRTPRLANLKFLRGYRRDTPQPEDVDRVLERIRLLGGRSSSECVIDSMAAKHDERARWLPVLWHLIGTRRVQVDLDSAFGPDVPLWLGED